VEKCLTGERINYQDWFNLPKGGMKYMNINLFPHLNKGKMATGFIIHAKDISEHKLAKEELQQKSEKRYKTLLQTTMDGFLIYDIQGQLLKANEAYCLMSGYSREELLTMCVSDLETTVTRDTVHTPINKIIRQGRDRFHRQYRRKDGTIFDVKVSVQHQAVDDDRIIIFIRDITEGEQTEKKLKESEKKCRLLADHAADVVRTSDMNMNLTYVSPSIERVSGFSVKKKMGHTLEQSMTPSSVQAIKQKVQEEFVKE